MKEKYFKNHLLEMWIEDGILYSKYGSVTIQAEDARAIIQERLKIGEGKTYPCYIDISAGAKFTKDARVILSTGDAMKEVNAGCLVVNKTQKLT